MFQNFKNCKKFVSINCTTMKKKKIRVCSTELLFRLRVRQERESEDWWRTRRRHADVHFRGDARFRLRAVLKHRKRASTATTRPLPCFRGLRTKQTRLTVSWWIGKPWISGSCWRWNEQPANLGKSLKLFRNRKVDLREFSFGNCIILMVDRISNTERFLRFFLRGLKI